MTSDPPWIDGPPSFEDEMAAKDDKIARLTEALRQSTQAEFSNARRMREAIVEARRRLAKGRGSWAGWVMECDAVLEQALSAFNDMAPTD